MGKTLDQKIRQLCEQAAKEQDTTRLMALVKMIIDTYDAEREGKERVDRTSRNQIRIGKRRSEWGSRSAK